MTNHTSQQTRRGSRTPWIVALGFLAALLIPASASARPPLLIVHHRSVARTVLVIKTQKVVHPKPAKRIWVRGHWKINRFGKRVWVTGHWKVRR